jgi:hypothetical protein
MSNRREFTKGTQRQAFARSGFRCEATGAMYGLAAGKRCNADLAKGVEFDHIVLDANSKDNSIENCAAVCIPCHRFKTAKHDIPMAAKTVRMQDKARGIKLKPAKKMQGAGFLKTDKPDRGTPNKGMPPLPRPQLYREESP